MSPLNIMIKPASGNCNLSCTYCFYRDVAHHRNVKSYGMMSINTLENIVIKSLNYAQDECNIIFQGGEPTLVGLDFYKQLIIFQKKYNLKDVQIHNAIQTNGMCIDKEWSSFFKENNFLVGLSIDGPREINDKFRLDLNGEGTYERLFSAAKMLEEHGIAYNILTVVTAQVAEKADKVYDQYKKNGWRYMQFIPCLDPLGEQRGEYSYSLTPKLYEYFLKALFDLWYKDALRGDFIYIRYFDNLLGMVMGFPPESCGMLGFCAQQYVVEADGSAYPCDFYVVDKYNLGNLNIDNFDQLDTTRNRIGFINESMVMDEKCMKCQWLRLCRGGCRRDRETTDSLEKNYFCEAYIGFFEYAYNRLILLAEQSRRMHEQQ